MDSPLQRTQTQRITRFMERLSALQCIKWFVVVVLIFKSLQVIYNTIILVVTMNQHTKAPFKLFISVYNVLVLVQIILFFLRHREYFRVTRLPDIQDNNELSLFSNFVDAFSLFWCLTGFHWTQECKTCKITAPWLYYTTYAWSFLGIFVVISPLIAIVLLIFIIAYFKPNLPVIEYKNAGEINKENANCSICLAEYNMNDKIKILPCNHHFHLNCIDEWFNIDDICPLCKKPINILYDLID
ncbi:putative E3 ubiquitin ligase [Trachipleistophora hominis]|uniref:Putative E3 ubiquitin ligase n=1 Tax=Trachipleistophora hominis TaxID=72359 RepID=L7K085_TRAHO|nr:putative E3 ubiquitin ligase [Trachipleistophora hominis]